MNKDSLIEYRDAFARHSSHSCFLYPLSLFILTAPLVFIATSPSTFGIEWTIESFKENKAYLVFLLGTPFFTSFLLLLYPILFNKKLTPPTCPSCNKSFGAITNINIVLASKNCPFCGEHILKD